VILLCPGVTVKNPKKILLVPALLALSFTAGTAPAGAEELEESPGWPPEDTGGKYVPVHPGFYDTFEVRACGTTVEIISGAVQEVEEKISVRRDGSTVIRYRGGSTVDLKRSDGAFVDELDVSGAGIDRISPDLRNVSTTVRGASIIFPQSAPDAAALAAAGFPEFFVFEKGRLTFELTFSDANLDLPTTVEITQNSARKVTDLCKLLDEAPKVAS
jgi:hypothetical protein